MGRIVAYFQLFFAFVVAQNRKTIFECDRHFNASVPFGHFEFPSVPRHLLRQHGNGSQQQNVGGFNLQCLYTFVAGPGQRVMLEFDHFQLAGSSESCDVEYVDVYSEIESLDEDLLNAAHGGRYCGSVVPSVRISLYRIVKLVLHSRAQQRHDDFGFRARYSFIPQDKFIPGDALPGKCNYVIYSKRRGSGSIYSPTYPGTYPQNTHCSYLLRGVEGQRIKIFLNDFDIHFGGEHCPYDALTVYDGESSTEPIVRKVCGLQQRTEIYSAGSSLLLHFNTTSPAKSDPRGFVIDYEFSDRFVKISDMLGGQQCVTHIRGTECDVRVESNTETTHYISSPNYPNAYPANTTCTYIIDGLQGDQNLEKVLFTFEAVAVLSLDSAPTDTPPSFDDIACPSAWVGVAISDANMKAAMSTTEDSVFDQTLCDRIPAGSPLLGPYESEGPRMVVQFGSTNTRDDNVKPLGFRAQIEFKTDFGVTGESMGTSNECRFWFNSSTGFFNSPRYPANYPLDTKCTYYIVGTPGKEILLHFEQFALFEEKESDRCTDWVEIYDVLYVDGQEHLRLQQRYCSDTFPGPSVSAFGSHEMRVIFSSDSADAANGFKALFEIRPARHEDIPSGEAALRKDAQRCGGTIYATPARTTGFLASPNYPIKYINNVHCDWQIHARPGYRILLKMETMEVEGEMTPSTASCQKAVIRVEGAPRAEYCGTKNTFFPAFLSENSSVRISFMTAPDKVNGLKGFNLAWTEARNVQGIESECMGSGVYLCTYSKLCIDTSLRCNGDDNCGYRVQDDTDEQHCLLNESSADKTVLVAAVFCGGIFLFICGFFFYLFKKKLERKKKKKRKDGGHRRQRQPYRQQRPVLKAHCDSELSSPATSRFVHHDATGMLPPIGLHQRLDSATPSPQPTHHTFYG